MQRIAGQGLFKRRGGDSNPRYELPRKHGFQPCAFNHSATSPGEWVRMVAPIRAFGKRSGHQPSRYPKMSGATMVASDSTMNRGVSGAIFSQVIFSAGMAPE